MKIIPFDIEKAKSGKYKIQTKGGYSARIICWDKKDKTYNLVALITFKDGHEEVASFTKTGDYYGIASSSLDLVLVCDNKQAIYEEINFILKNIDMLVKDGHTPIDLAYDKCTLLIMNKILPKWKRIHKGEKLPETSYVKSDFHAQSFMPCIEGVEMGSDCWYLPVTILNEFEHEAV